MQSDFYIMKKTFYSTVLKLFDILETVFTIAFVVSMALLLNEEEYSLKIISGVLVLIAVLYWLMSLEPKSENDSLLKLYTSKATWLTLSIGVLGILMKLQFDEKANLLLLLGFLSIIFSVILNIYLYIKEKNKIKPAVFVRASIYILICLYLYTL